MNKIKFLVFIQIVSCVSFFAQNIQTKNVNYSRISFELNNDNRILIPVCIDGITYTMEFDTGSNQNLFNKNGMQKILQIKSNDEDEIVKCLTDNFHKANPQIDVESLKEYVCRQFDSGQLSMTCNNILCDSTTVNTANFKFVPENENYFSDDNSTIDGIVGLCLFGEIKNITINYKTKIIELNAPEISGIKTPLYYMNTLGLYFVLVNIDGVEQQALVDTGAAYISIRKEYTSNKKYTQEELISYINEKRTVNLEENTGIQREIQFGDSKKKYTTYSYTETKFECNPAAREILTLINSLGFPFFEGRCIQLDFENKIMSIEE